MNGLDALLASILAEAQSVAWAADAFRKTAADIGLGKAGAGLIALGHRARFFAYDALKTEGKVPPTLWLFDDENRQWAFDAEFMSTEDEPEVKTNWATTRLLLTKLGAVAYILVAQTVSVKVDRDTTVMERKRLRESGKADECVVIWGESIDGGGLMMSYKLNAGTINVDDALSMLVGRKDRWPGPPGAAFTDHGFPVLLP